MGDLNFCAQSIYNCNLLKFTRDLRLNKPLGLFYISFLVFINTTSNTSTNRTSK